MIAYNSDAMHDSTRDNTPGTFPDPWADTETEHLRAFLKLTHTERFHLLMQAIEFLNLLRPADTHTDLGNRPADT